jgi:hypothetical protein
LFHGDLHGTTTTAAVGGNTYFLLVVDNRSRYMWVKALRSKDQAFAFFRKMKAIREKINMKPGPFQRHRGGGFNSNEFYMFFDEHGITEPNGTLFSATKMDR